MLRKEEDPLDHIDDEAAKPLATGYEKDGLREPTAACPTGLFANTAETLLTVDDVNRLNEEDNDRGLSHVFRMTCHDAHVNPPINRADLALFTLTLSEPITHTV